MNLDLDFSRCRVLVIGDAMLDVYYTGAVERISPEAPVPVVKTHTVKRVPGGAANVCNNLASLGGRATLLSFLGDDENSGHLTALLKAERVDVVPVVTAVPCVTKIRVVGGHQQIVRVDFDSAAADFTAADYRAFEAEVRRLVPQHDLVILSDYAKGVCSEAVCRAVIDVAGTTPVLVDPKHNSWAKYSGAAMVKPNLKELSEAVGRLVPNENLPIEQAAQDLRERFKVGAVLVTRSDKGMSYVDASGAFHEPATKQEVFDVSGAGDTVLATAALMWVTDSDRRDAVHLANIAAGIVVGKVGTACATPGELLQRLAGGPGHLKIVSQAELVAARRELGNRGETLVFTNGCFDILHHGHVDYLRRARALGSVLAVGLNSDASTRRLKGPSRPINPEQARASLLAALEFVDYVTVFEDDTPLDLIRAVRPDVLVKGGDYQIEGVVGREFAGRTQVLPFVDGFSTTKIVEKMKQS